MPEDEEAVKSKRWKILVSMAVITAASMAFAMLLLLVTGLIPKSMIKDACMESSAYFEENELFPFLVDGQFNTRQDNYADCILINIMYHIDSQDLLRSLIRADYYNPQMESVEISLADSLKEDKTPDVAYFRYWHGGMVLLRPLFLFTGILGARAVLGGSLLLLTVLTAVLMWKRKAKALAVCYLLGNMIVQTWMCAFCIEYVTTFLVMNVVLIILLICFRKKKDTDSFYRRMYRILCAAGVWTCFFDFLTTETLAATMPILLVLVLRYEAGELEGLQKEIKRMLYCLLCFGISYAVMFVTKWGISVVVLGRQAFLEALKAAGERIGGTVYLGNTNLDPEASAMQRFLGALIRNEGCLFPFRDAMAMGAAAWLFIGVLFLCFASVYMLRGKNFDGRMIILCILIGAVPYLRYMVLENHAYLHYFFTYRAQLVTVTMLLYVTWGFGWKNLLKEDKKGKRV